MKKIAKVWVLCLAFASSVVALLVSATSEFTSQVTLTLTEWSNTCTLNDYTFNQKQASPVDQITESLWETISCSFLKNSANQVSLSMSNLSSAAGVIIPASNFSGQITSWITLWSIWNLEDKVLPTLNNQPIVYEKWENTIGEWSGTMTLQWIIPWWTPAWTYTGTIDLVLQVK